MKKLAQSAVAGAASLALGLGFVATSATAANAVTSSYTFKIDSLSESNGVQANVTGDIGDDGGFVAVTSDVLLLDGDSDTYSYNLDSLGSIAAVDAGFGDEELFTDLGTETAYVAEVKNTGGNDFFDSATALDTNGNMTSTVVTFSESIEIGNGDDWAAASGAGQIAFWNSTTGDLYVVSLPSGAVKVVTVASLSDFTGVQPAFNHSENDSGLAFNSVLEFDCTTYSIVTLDTDENYSRFDLSAATQETLLTNTSTGGYFDDDNFVVSPSNGRWYAHGEDDGETEQFGINLAPISSGDEYIISADATSTTTADVCKDPSPELPNTGMNGSQSGLLAAAAGVLALAGVAFIVARRRISA